jgi:hypothetical protein
MTMTENCFGMNWLELWVGGKSHGALEEILTPFDIRVTDQEIPISLQLWGSLDFIFEQGLMEIPLVGRALQQSGIKV